MSEELKPCPFCGCKDIAIICNGIIFKGQCYSDRYPAEVANQNHGYKTRCEECGNQTCFWHYQNESIKAWNTRI